MSGQVARPAPFTTDEQIGGFMTDKELYATNREDLTEEQQEQRDDVECKVEAYIDYLEAIGYKIDYINSMYT